MDNKIVKIIFPIVAFIICFIMIFIIGYRSWAKENEKIIEATVPLETIELKEVVEEEPAPEEPELISLGEFKLTAYCSCQKCCGKWALNRPLDENGNEIVYGASGEKLIAGASIAVDPNVIPLGSEVIINGNVYIAHDTGSAVKGNVIDVYHDNHEAAWNFGLQYAEVFMEVDNETE